MFTNSFTFFPIQIEEVLPTCIRGRGFGTLNGVGKVAMIVSPQIMKLNSDDQPWVSSAIFTTSLIAAAIITYTLPETADKQLTETLDEAERTFS